MDHIVTLSHVPRLAPMLVERPRLTTRLDERPALILLRAPVGFGKTTTIQQWIATHEFHGSREDEVVAWLRVRRGTSSASDFWLEALQVLADAGLPVPSWSDETDPTRLARLAERALLDTDRAVLLVVDGFEHVTDRSLDSLVLDLLRHVHHLRLVLCLRGERHFQPYRHLDLESLELTSRDLRFTADETRRLLELADVGLSPEQIEYIQGELSGWPEPTRAVALRLRERNAKASATVPDLVDDIVTEYFRNRLLGEPDGPIRRELALRTALLDEFTREAAEILADKPVAQADLDSMVSSGFLVSTMRDGEQVFHWPVTARKVLRAELARLRPDLIPELHARLARWYLEGASAVLALQHAVDSGDWPLVIQVIEANWRTLLHDPAMLDEVFLALPVEEAARSPRALALRDMTLRFADDQVLKVPMLPDDVEELERIGRKDDAAETLETCVALLIALRRRGSFALARVYGPRALVISRSARQLHSGEVLARDAVLHMQVGITQLLADDLPAALPTLRDAFERGASHPMGYIENDAAGKLALALTLFGDRREAEAWLRLHQKTPILRGSWVSPFIESTGLAAELLLALDDVNLERADRAQEKLLGRVGRDEFWAFLIHARARHALHTGAAADLLKEITRARRLYGHRMVEPGISRPLVAATEADLLLALGRGNLAEVTLSGPDAEHPLLRVPRARLALLTGRPEHALALSGDSQWERHAGQRDVLTMMVIRSVAASRADDRTLAISTLERAIRIAARRHIWQPFLTVPRTDLDLLLAETAERERLARGPYATHPSLFPEDVHFVELTDRELEVLQDLARGLTVRQIAEVAVLSYNTVRTQQRSLYKKLGTSDRAEAISRAKEWGLLSPDVG